MTWQVGFAIGICTGLLIGFACMFLFVILSRHL